MNLFWEYYEYSDIEAKGIWKIAHSQQYLSKLNWFCSVIFFLLGNAFQWFSNFFQCLNVFFLYQTFRLLRLMHFYLISVYRLRLRMHTHNMHIRMSIWLKENFPPILVNNSWSNWSHSVIISYLKKLSEKITNLNR